MRPCIYMIKNQINNKGYVGQTVNAEKRWKQHKWGLNNNRHDNNYLQNAWNKYGSDSFSFEVIKECEEEYLDELEIFYIHFYDAMNNGYNLTEGGDHGKFSLESRAKMSEAKSGENNPMYGKKGKDHPRYGTHHSEKDKKKISEAQRGEKCCLYGKYGEDHPRAKYTLWDSGKCSYNKKVMFQGNRDGSPCRCFATRYKGQNLPIGYNMDFLSCEIIHNLILDAIKDE